MQVNVEVTDVVIGFVKKYIVTPLVSAVLVMGFGTIVYANGNLPVMPDVATVEVVDSNFNTAITVVAEKPQPIELYTLDKVNFRVAANVDSEVIETLPIGTKVSFIAFKTIGDERFGWREIVYNNVSGFMKSEFVGTEEESKEAIIAAEKAALAAAEEAANAEKNSVQLLEWSQAKKIFTIGVVATVYDVRTGLTYNVKSFSNGNHADVEPVTKEDTAIMHQTYGYNWDWDARPIWITINGHTLAASINGMPHGGGVNNSNGMNGQVCIHFKGSTTHNGSSYHEKDHQNSIAQAWNAANK